MSAYPEIDEVLAGERDWCVITGDCLEVMAEMPDGCADAVVTDPPYGVNLGYRVHRVALGAYATGDDSEESIRTLVVPRVSGSLRIARRAAVMPGDRCMWFYPRPEVTGAVWLPNGVGMSKWGFICWQPILYYGIDPTTKNGGRPNLFVGTGRADKTIHPCAKPLAWMEWLVRRVSQAGEIIYDPFCGSGTTGMACRKLGRRFIGIEIDPCYAEIARNHIASTPKPLFTPEQAEPQQQQMFAAIEEPKP